MSLLGKALVFVLLGCVYSEDLQDFTKRMQQLGQVNKNLAQLDSDLDFINGNNPYGQGSSFDSNVHLGQGGDDEAAQYIQKFKQAVQQMVMILQLKCQEAGHNEVIESLEAKIRGITRCVEGKVDVKDIGEKYSEAVRIGDLPNFFRKYCRVWPDVHGCISPLVSSIEKCLSTEEDRAIDKSIDLIDYSNSYFCDNSAQQSIKFIENQGFQCMTSVKDELNSCSAEAMRRAQQKAQNQKSTVMTYDDNVCGEFHNLRKCFVGKMATCESKEPSEIMDDFLQKIATKACSAASSLTWFSFVNIILVLGTYLYSKTF